MANKLIKKIEIKGELELLTGMHIGGTNSSMQIGGIDKSVIRNPITNIPFIPGSSLKGKMRSLFEVAEGTFGPGVSEKLKHGAAQTGPSADLFGNATNDEKQKPSRLIARDCDMINHKLIFENTDMPYTEGKTEVVIDRITSAASPRQIERVPAGAKFSLNLVLNIWEQDANEEQLISNMFKSLELLRDDYIGGSGSRGYGQISIDITDMLEKSSTAYYGIKDAEAVSVKSKYQNQIDKLKS